MRPGALLLPALAAALAACAAPEPRHPYFLEDRYARYYTASSARTLRVENDGTVLDVTCLPVEVVQGKPLGNLPRAACPDSKIPVLGKARKAGEDWDMQEFEVARDTGRCLPLFEAPGFDERDVRPRRSCWNRAWEVPVAVIAVPAVFLLAVGLISAPIWAPILFLR